MTLNVVIYNKTKCLVQNWYRYFKRTRLLGHIFIFYTVNGKISMLIKYLIILYLLMVLKIKHLLGTSLIQ